MSQLQLKHWTFLSWVRLIYTSENGLLWLVATDLLCCNSHVELQRQGRWWLIIWCYQPLPNENKLHLLLIISPISVRLRLSVRIDVFSVNCSSKISPLSDSAIFPHKYQWSMTIRAAGLLRLDINAIREKYQHSPRWWQGVILQWTTWLERCVYIISPAQIPASNIVVFRNFTFIS